MTPAQRHYVTIETLISVAINMAISIGFAWVAFGSSSFVAARAVVFDAAPQSFMIGLMSVVVPGLLTQRRLAKGQIAPIEGGAVRCPLAARALGTALFVALAGVALHAALLGLIVAHALEFHTVMALKAGYGALLAAVVTPTMLRYALRTG